MSIFTKIRNILIIIKVFYWLSFKATVRSIFINKTMSLYTLSYQVHINTGLSMRRNTIKSKYSKANIHSL